MPKKKIKFFWENHITLMPENIKKTRTLDVVPHILYTDFHGTAIKNSITKFNAVEILIAKANYVFTFYNKTKYIENSTTKSKI